MDKRKQTNKQKTNKPTSKR